MSRPFNKNMKTGDIAPSRHPFNYQNPRPVNIIQAQNNNPKQMHVTQIQNSTPQHMIPMNQNHSMHSNINVGPMNNMPVNPQNYQPIRINQRQNNQRNFNARPNHQYAPVPVNFDGPFIHSYVPYSPLNIMQNPYYAIGPQICQIPSQNPIRLPNPPSTSIANEVIPSAVLENQKIMPPPIQQASPHQSSHSQVGRKKKTAILQDPDSLEEKDLVEYAKLPFSSSSTSSNNNQANKIDKNEEVKQNTASSNDKKIMEFLQLSCLAQSPAKTNETNLDKKQNEEQVKQTEVKNKEIKNEKVHEAVSVNNPKETTEKSLSSGNKVATQTSKVVQPATTESTSNVSKKSQQDQILVKKDDIDQKTVPVLVNEPVKVETEEMETVRAIETKLDNLKISNPPETKVNKDDKIDSLVKTKPELKVSEKSSTSQNKTEDQKQSSVEKLNEVQDQKKQSSDASNLQKTKSTSDLLIYDVDFLKNLQFTEISTQKPNFGNLGHRLEIVLDKARRDNESFDYSNDFQPKFGKPSINNRNINGRNSMQMGRLINVENKMPRKILSSSLTQDVKLRSIDNAWKPILYKNSNDDSKDSTDVLIKNARGILNKLTPQNFKKLLDQFLGLKIDTEDKLRKMIELIFDKSVDEPAFCDQYALLCKHLSNIQIESDKGTPIKFNNLLLEKCQSLFEQDKYKELDLASRQKVIDDCKDKDKKQILKDELDEDKRIVRKKSLGNIKFIGALYKNNRLKEKIMNECIYHLLDEKEEDSYECLCSLLKSIGETYEKSIFESKQDLKRNFDKQMNALEDVVKQNQVTSRIKFLIMDVLDMRREGWKIRKLQDTFKPKTLDEVHEDIKRQDEISNREINQISKRNDSMKRKDWMNPQRKSQQKESLINIRKLNDLNKQQQTNFAPTGFFASWSSGALGAKPVESDNSKPASLVSKNFSFRYQSEDKYKNNSLKQRNSSNVEKNVEVVSTFGGNYHGGDEQKDMNFIAAYEVILKEYIENGSLDDCLRAICQKSTENCVYLFVQSATEQACETYLKEINKIGNLLAELVCVKKVISYQQFHKGLKYHLDGAQEVVKDIPLFFEYIGQILSHFFFKLPDQDRRSFFKEALCPCLEIGESLTIIIHLLKSLISSKENIVEIAKKWVNAGLSFEDFVNNETEASVNEILESNGLSSLLNEINTLKTDIVVQIEAADFNDINKVLKNLNIKDKTLSKKIISALTEKCILTSTNKLPNGDPQLDKDSFMSNLKIFQQSIIENLNPKILQDADIQLEIIYSFIKVSGNLKNPKDFLFNSAVSLQESDIVDQETFLKWFKEGRKDILNNSVALLQLKRFIEILESDDSDGDEDIADVN